MDSTVYVILNLQNGKCYIGSTVDYHKRHAMHLSRLRRGISHCPHLQAAWNKYGEDTFWFGVLEHIAVDPREAEQYYLDLIRPEYNSHLSATAGRLGIPHTAATRTKISQTKIERGSHRGENSAVNKLTSQQVIEIRRRLLDGERSYQLATSYGCSRTCINNIKMGKSWRHIPYLLSEVIALPDGRIRNVPPRRKAYV